MKVTCFIFFSLVISVANGQNRKLSYSENPGCDKPCPAGIMIHVQADGPNDTVHHIWDFTKGQPTAILAITQPNDTLKINWTQFLNSSAPESIKFERNPSYVFAVALDKIIEFDDVDNLGYFNPEAKFNKTEISANDLKWKIGPIKYEKEEIVAEFRASDPHKHIGELSVRFRAYSSKDHTEVQPHILHTSNATVIELVLDKMTTHFNNSRFAINLLLFSSNSVDNLPQNKRSSFDDEHSPGAFTTAEIFTTDEESKEYSGYLQWRTIAYTSVDKTHTQSTRVYDLRANRIDDPAKTFNGSTIQALVGQAINETPSHSVIVSFGAKDDGFYAKKAYTSFSFAAGIGQPAEEAFSLFVTLILSIGLGIPALLVVVASVCIIARRVSRTRDGLFLTQ